MKIKVFKSPELEPAMEIDSEKIGIMVIFSDDELMAVRGMLKAGRRNLFSYPNDVYNNEYVEDFLYRHCEDCDEFKAQYERDRRTNDEA